MIGPYGTASIGLIPSADIKDECRACMLANDPIELRIGNRTQKLIIIGMAVGYGAYGLDCLTLEVRAFTEGTEKANGL